MLELLWLYEYTINTEFIPSNDVICDTFFSVVVFCFNILKLICLVCLGISSQNLLYQNCPPFQADLCVSLPWRMLFAQCTYFKNCWYFCYQLQYSRFIISQSHPKQK